MDIPIQVQTTTQDKPAAEAIAQTLLEARLAACVQISGPVTSIYRWQGNVERAEEWTCVVKTVQRLYPQVETTVRRLHPYEEPEITLIEIRGGSRSYLNWLVDQLVPEGPLD
jgi:periplasmic divalent cation tolerance protein